LISPLPSGITDSVASVAKKRRATARAIASDDGTGSAASVVIGKPRFEQMQDSHGTVIYGCSRAKESV
jgi:hypothetical protein